MTAVEQDRRGKFFLADFGCCVPTSDFVWMLVVMFIFTVLLVIFCLLVTAFVRWVYKRRMRKKGSELKSKFANEERMKKELEIKLKYLAARTRAQGNQMARQGNQAIPTTQNPIQKALTQRQLKSSPGKRGAPRGAQEKAKPPMAQFLVDDETPYANSTLNSCEPMMRMMNEQTTTPKVPEAPVDQTKDEDYVKAMAAIEEKREQEDLQLGTLAPVYSKIHVQAKRKASKKPTAKNVYYVAKGPTALSPVIRGKAPQRHSMSPIKMGSPRPEEVGAPKIKSDEKNKNSDKQQESSKEGKSNKFASMLTGRDACPNEYVKFNEIEETEDGDDKLKKPKKRSNEKEKLQKSKSPPPKSVQTSASETSTMSHTPAESTVTTPSSASTSTTTSTSKTTTKTEESHPMNKKGSVEKTKKASPETPGSIASNNDSSAMGPPPRDAGGHDIYRYSHRHASPIYAPSFSSSYTPFNAPTTVHNPNHYSQNIRYPPIGGQSGAALRSSHVGMPSPSSLINGLAAPSRRMRLEELRGPVDSTGTSASTNTNQSSDTWRSAHSTMPHGAYRFSN